MKVHELITPLLVGTFCVTFVSCSGCSNRADEQRAEARRQVLRGENLAEKHAQIVAETRTTDGKGGLIPSNIEAAGITIPRGYELRSTFDHEWHYDGALSVKQLEKYFLERLDAQIERPDATSVVFKSAVQKGSSMHPVLIKIMDVPRKPDWSELRIYGPRPAAPAVSDDDVRAELKRRRESE
ncbi:MAG: hypothetical protein RL701_1710 [Pseudomonadota bacterium]